MNPFPAILCAGLCLGSTLRPPFPEVWNSNPLRYPYAPEENLRPAPASRPLKTTPEKIASPIPNERASRLRDFQLPAQARGPIRVLIATGAKEVIVTAPSDSRLSWLLENNSRGERIFSSGELRVQFRRGKFRVSGKGNGTFSEAVVLLRLEPESPESPLEVNGKSYRGSLLFSEKQGRIRCVNSLPMEEYLRGVVPLEMGRRGADALEALKAQAVVARSYALKFKLTPRDEAFDLYTSVQDQVYGGRDAEDSVSDRAIQQTGGHVLLYSDSLALCFYHSTCAGLTASRHEVWGGPAVPYLITLSDRDGEGNPWCGASRYMEWIVTWKARDLVKIMRRNLAAANVFSAPPFNRLKGFEVRHRFSDGRIDVLEVATDRGSFELRGDKIRVALRTPEGNMLASARFDIEKDGDHFIAKGSGYGHGVGLCQFGALARSRAGQEYEQILRAYYQAAVLALAR